MGSCLSMRVLTREMCVCNAYSPIPPPSPHLECEHVQPVAVRDVTPAVQLHQVLQVTHLMHRHMQGAHAETHT
jgi:hypothetical protein